MEDQIQHIDAALERLRELNPEVARDRRPATDKKRPHRLQKVLIANRGEIAKRFFLALHEEGIPSVAVVTEPDIGQSWYDFADEVIQIGDANNYINMPVIVAAALLSGSNAVYPGYGFLSEKHEFAEMIERAAGIYGRDLVFMGPRSETMKRLGDKIEARRLARENNITLFDGSDMIVNRDDALTWARRIGFPVIVKLSSGGGGRGIIIVDGEKDLADAIDAAQRIGMAHYRDDTFFIEQFIKNPVHMEVQIFNGWAIGIRKCAVQRNNQKIIEESGHEFLDESTYLAMLADAERMARVSGYTDGCGAGTVEFLLDAETGRFGFLEVNTRLQVEYAVTEQSLGIDLVKWQVLHFDGRGGEIPFREVLKYRLMDKLHSIECRINAEEPENSYRPSPGRIQELILPTFHGIRCDFGFAGSDTVPPHYDAMIGKIIATGTTRRESVIRLERALQELYIKGFHTNVKQLINIVRHPRFQAGDYTNRLLADHPELHAGTPSVGGSTADDSWLKSVVMFGALSEYIRLYNQRVKEFAFFGGMDTSFRNRGLTAFPSGFRVSFMGADYSVEVFQQNRTRFHLYVDGEFGGRIELSSYSGRTDDFLFRFGPRSYRIRAEKRITHISIRMKDRENKINYYRVQVEPEGIEESTAAQGLVRSPFQCTFVSLCGVPAREGARIGIGSRVSRGDPVMIVSSMKMETTITAPVSGIVDVLIDDGDYARLVQGTSARGEVSGRGIQEGEVLFIIKEDRTGESDTRTGAATAAAVKPVVQILPDSYLEDTSRNLPRLLKITRAYLQGFIQRDRIRDEIVKHLDRLLESGRAVELTPESEAMIGGIIRFYGHIRQIFSPVLAGETSFFDELNHYFTSSGNHPYRPPAEFKKLIDAILDFYADDRAAAIAGADGNAVHQVFLHIQRSYYVCLENRNIVTGLLRLLSQSCNKMEATYDALTILLQHEESEPDDSLAKITRELIEALYPAAGGDLFSDDSDVDFETQSRLPMPDLGKDRDELKVLFKVSMQKRDTDLVPGPVPGWAGREITEKLAIIGAGSDIYRLYSPVPGTFVYSVIPRGGREGAGNHYLVFSYLDSLEGTAAARDDGGTPSITLGGLNQLLSNNLKILNIYNAIERSAGNRMEILAGGTPLPRDPETNSVSGALFRGIRESCERAMSSSWFVSIGSGLIHLDIENTGGGTERIMLEFGKESNRVRVDILAPGDVRNPYRTGTGDENDGRMYELGKWPVEDWTARCFDRDSAEEITVPGVDDCLLESGSGTYRVAGKIFLGRVCGSEALFYLKDFRVRGGATGDREGMKYAAAIFLARARGCPLYVWNDSAGANINEGMISLNRGGQGFMLNSLISNRAGDEEFEACVLNHPDRGLGALYRDITARYGTAGETAAGPRPNFIVSVGTGSSAGLDVYGASQTAVQILLDSEQAFRVLTGSNVIRSVMGEKVSNYDIGGARVMGKWAGIVDLVSADRFSLISHIRRIHRLFSRDESLSAIARGNAGDAGRPFSGGRTVLSEQAVSENVDAGSFMAFKDDYHASRELVGGFARIGGRKFLVMGPRNLRGLRTFASVTRARELLNTARGTAAHRLLILGKQWHQRADHYDSGGIRARMDFLGGLRGLPGITIAVITDIDGFQAVELTSMADAIIFVRYEGIGSKQYEFARKNATFTVSSLTEAFDRAHRIAEMIDPAAPGTAHEAPADQPRVPDDPGVPYDIIPSVIEKVFDAGSFLECYGEMNDPVAGPNLVTGLARLEGRTVGVIADQPLTQGGGADAPGTQKFRIFTRFLNSFSIPLVMISNSSGFVPGIKQERLRIQAIGAESLNENILGRIPVVSLVLNQNYGGRQIQAFNRHLRPGIVAIALERSIMAVIGPGVAFDLLQKKKHADLIKSGKKAEAEALRENFMAGYIEKARAKNDALRSGALDWVIPDAAELRSHIMKAMKLAEERCREAFRHLRAQRNADL